MKFNTKALAQLTLSLTLLAGIVVVSTTTTFAQEKEEKTSTKHAKKAKISLAAARATALQKAPGKVEGEELEKEKGKLVYSFDIRNDRGTISEVWVDAKTGKVIKVEEENAAAEAKEKKEDAKKKP
ncbi:MAG TPA: PepSY domain-containing protein [Pyrinomonadaceae bacterium]|nr:PepSY domain-containing protein [Chloracidobacterium sp.]MBP9936046.1 PepSY domain-containing protein [Pyrinomonadaceae bacterium]MBK7802155.1 PepSY domain-containing protein [Chloracidobacterium sp.]MBK9437699.1 PepSY domain-containing protein [Chloracidobacterium sp.]MBK9767877.1 PepSY domain-containing protein [Chloracidobacterium sp.]